MPTMFLGFPVIPLFLGLTLLPGTCLSQDTANIPDKPSAYTLHTTERLLKEQLSCLGCHRLGNQGGLLAPDLLNIKYNRAPDYLRQMISDPQSVLPGTMMPRVRMTPEKREAIVTYLLHHSHPERTPTQVFSYSRLTATSSRSGASLFQHYCAGCHGPSGRGNGVNAQTLAPPPTDFTDTALMSKRPDDTLFDIIAAGGRVFDLNPRMPAWGHTLGPGDIRALVAHIRTLCHCQGPEWSRDGR